MSRGRLGASARRSTLSAAALAVLLSWAGGATAQRSSWTNPAVGNWFVAGNWDFGVPAADVTAGIDNDGFAFINSPGATALGFSVGFGGGPGYGYLDVTGAGTLSTNWLLLDGGTLQVLGGGKATVLPGNPALGNGVTQLRGLGQPVLLRVADAGSLLNAGSTLVSGALSAARVENGGRIVSDSLTLAYSQTLVSGQNALWTVAGETRFDGTPGGSTRLTVANRGTLNTGSTVVGVTGLLNVAGAGSSFNNAGQLALDGGTVSVNNGAWLTTATSSIGNLAGPTGSVRVDGVGTHWVHSGDMVVGNTGTGEVDVSSGGWLTSLRGHVGYAAGSSGAVTVRGDGSSWIAAGSMFIGNAGIGSLSELEGGSASTSGNAYLGLAAGAHGQATVGGAGSSWNITVAGTNLNIGGNQLAAGGNGSLTIEAGGSVNTASTHLYRTGSLLLVDSGRLSGHLSSWGGLLRSRGQTGFTGPLTLEDGGLLVEPLDTATTTTFSGNIDGPGGLHKSSLHGLTGAGTVVLSGHNTYAGATIIDLGTVRIEGRNRSAVQVNAGTLGGGGVIDGAVTIGNNAGAADARLAPGAQGPGIGTLATGDLRFDADGVYAYDLDSLAAAADRIVVTGSVTLAGAAVFTVGDLGAGRLPPGTTFIAIDNDGDDAILGQFAGLPEGLQFSVGANTYQLSYAGGSGNDLVLSAIPEPASCAMWLVGLAVLWQLRRARAALRPEAQH